MLKIRLTRRGKKNKAFFRLVVAEHTAPIKGKFIEVLGFLNPHTKEKNFKTDRIKYWIEKGAQCSDSVHNLLVANGIVKGPKRAVKLKKKPAEEPKETEKKTEEAKSIETSMEASEEVSKKDKAGKPEEDTKTGEVKDKKAEPAQKAAPNEAGGEKKEEKKEKEPEEKKE